MSVQENSTEPEVYEAPDRLSSLPYELRHNIIQHLTWNQRVYLAQTSTFQFSNLASILREIKFDDQYQYLDWLYCGELLETGLDIPDPRSLIRDVAFGFNLAEHTYGSFSKLELTNLTNVTRVTCHQVNEDLNNPDPFMRRSIPTQISKLDQRLQTVDWIQCPTTLTAIKATYPTLAVMMKTNAKSLYRRCKSRHIDTFHTNSAFFRTEMISITSFKNGNFDTMWTTHIHHVNLQSIRDQLRNAPFHSYSWLPTFESLVELIASSGFPTESVRAGHAVVMKIYSVNQDDFERFSDTLLIHHENCRRRRPNFKLSEKFTVIPATPEEEASPFCYRPPHLTTM